VASKPIAAVTDACTVMKCYCPMCDTAEHSTLCAHQINTWFIEPTQVCHRNGISIGLAVFVQSTHSHCTGIVQCYSLGGTTVHPELTHGSYVPLKSAHKLYLISSAIFVLPNHHPSTNNTITIKNAFQWEKYSQKAPPLVGPEPHIIHYSLGTSQSPPQTASQSLQ